MQDTENILTVTRNWINNVVIGCNFCPFAAREIRRNSVHFELASATDPDQVLGQYHQLLQQMDENPAIETAFLILPEGFSDFMYYLDLVEMAEDLIEDEDYEGIYQVASFHPDYLFAGSDTLDPANYTNRSPYPMLHLLREESIEKALEHYPGDPDEIPERNIRFAREKGLAYMKTLFNSGL
jgi:hypothetical protein